MIYLDNAATSFPKPSFVKQAVVDAMDNIGSDGRGAHEMTLRASRIVYSTRQNISKLFNADAMRVCFTLNATMALNTAILGLINANDHVITSVQEHNSVLRPLYKTGADLTFLPIDEKGNVKIDMLGGSLKENTKAVILSHVSNVTGNVIDIKKVGRFCKEHNLYFIVDAAQSAGVFDIDMKEMNISVLCFTGHKGLLGVQGTGGLCVAKGIDINPLVTGGSGVHSFSKTHPDEYPTRLEAGTLNAHGLAGLNASVKWLNENGLASLREKETSLARLFYNELCNLSQIKIYGDVLAENHGAIVSINIADEDAGIVSDALYEDFRICTRAGAHCAPLIHKAFGTDRQGMVRFSFSHQNTEDEVIKTIEAIKQLVAE